MPTLKKRKPGRYNVPHGDCTAPWVCYECESVTYRPEGVEQYKDLVMGYIISLSTFVPTKATGSKLYPTWRCNDCEALRRFYL